MAGSGRGPIHPSNGCFWYLDNAEDAECLPLPVPRPFRLVDHLHDGGGQSEKQQEQKSLRRLSHPDGSAWLSERRRTGCLLVTWRRPSLK